MHQNFVFDTTGGIGGELGAFFNGEAFDRLDQADGADRDQVFTVLTGVFEFFHDMGHETQVVFDEHIARMFVPLGHQAQIFRFIPLGERLREGVVLDV